MLIELLLADEWTLDLDLDLLTLAVLGQAFGFYVITWDLDLLEVYAV